MPNPRVSTHAYERPCTHIKDPSSPCQSLVDYGNTKITSVHLYPQRRNVAAQVVEGLNTVTYQSYGDTHTIFFSFFSFRDDEVLVPEETREPELAVGVELGGHPLQFVLWQRGQVGLQAVGHQRGPPHLLQVLQAYMLPGTQGRPPH